MRYVVVLAMIGAILPGCDNKPKMTQAEIEKWSNMPPMDANGNHPSPTVPMNKAVANMGLEKISYPKCDTLVGKNNITKCGKNVFKVAMGECRGRVKGWTTGGSLLDEYSSDIWQERAGISEMASDETRANDLAVSENQRRSPQYLAVALGDGTDTIRHFACDIDERLRLRSIYSAG